MHTGFFIVAFILGIFAFLFEFKTNIVWRAYASIFNVERENPKSGFLVGAPWLTRITASVVLMIGFSFLMYNFLTWVNIKLTFELVEVIFYTSAGFFAGSSLLEFLAIWRKAKEKGFTKAFKELFSRSKKFAQETVEDIKSTTKQLNEEKSDNPEVVVVSEDKTTADTITVKVTEKAENTILVSKDEKQHDLQKDVLELKNLDVVETKPVDVPPPKEKKKTMDELLNDIDKNLE
ncbi:hypothetical protein KA405_01785 [Patescibacteria group bacterium]|nr:hypothetical protein [Patescibacteria group bacterium]